MTVGVSVTPQQQYIFANLFLFDFFLKFLNKVEKSSRQWPYFKQTARM